MADNKTAKRKVYIYIDGTQVEKSVDGISKELRRVQRDQKQMVLGSQEYIRATQKINQLKGILSEHDNSIRKVGSSWGGLQRVSGGFSKYFAVITSTVASLTGLTFALRRSVDEFAQLEEKEADVRKYTGMTREQIKALNEDFKKMDTRTSREQLNALAADAGRLGIQSKEGILEFVQAADIINVALGEDLGKDAIKNIGKLAQMFSVEGQSLKEGMLAVGSAINEVAQNSSAAEPYLVDFTARLSGTAKQAGMSVSDIIGFASALDQNMQQVEMSATALQNLIMKVYQEPAKFAKLAGKDVKEFSNLLKTDANEAIIQLLTSLRNAGGLDKLAPVFKDMGLEGVRASGVINTLAGNIEKVRKEQERANQAYKDGTSTTNEFNVKNNTLQATFEKAKKDLKEFSYELGEKLAPYMTRFISPGGSMVKVLSVIISFLIKYSGTITVLAVSIGSYIVTLKLMELWTKRATIASAASAVVNGVLKGSLYLLQVAYYSLTGQMAKARGAMVAFNLVTKMHPYAAIAALVTILAGAYVLLRKKIDLAAKSSKARFEIENQAQKNTSEEILKIQQLKTIIENSGSSYRLRKKAIQDLQEIIPDYHASLDNEGKLINHNSNMIDIYVKKLEVMEKQKLASARLAEATTNQDAWYKSVDNESASRFLEVDLYKRMNHGVNDEEAAASVGVSPTAYRAFDAKRKSLEQEVEMYRSLMSKYTKEMISIDEQYYDSFKPDKTVIPKIGKDSKEDDTQKKIKEIEDRATILRAAAIANYAIGKSDRITYENELYEIELNALEEQKVLYKSGSAEEAKVQERIYKLKIDERKKFLDQYHNLSMTELDKSFESEKQALELQHKSDFLSEEAYYEGLLRETIKYLNAKKKIYEDNPEMQIQIQEEIDKTTTESQSKRTTRFENKKEQFLSEYVTKDPEEMKNDELNALQLLYDKKQLKEEEYQQIKKGIIDKYNAMELEQDAAKFEEKTRLAQESLSMLQSMMSAFQDFVSASQELEEAQVNKKYDAEIKAAGQNSATTKKIEEKREKELAGIKSKYADKAFGMQVSMALASTAQAAINAYASAAEIPFIGAFKLGPLAAGMAIAAGMIQVATIRKQQQAAKKGYFFGGFTPKGRWDQEQGTVHSDEFVANRFATNNSTLRPMFEMVDYAQRSGTVSNLTKDDLAAALGFNVYARSGQNVSGSSNTDRSQVADNDSIHFTEIIQRNTEIIDKLYKKLQNPLEVHNSVLGPNGMKQAFDEYNSLIKNKSRN